MTPMTWHPVQAASTTSSFPRRRQRPLAAAVALTLALAGGAALAQATGGTPGTAGSSASGRAGSTGSTSSTSSGMSSNSAGSSASASRLAASDRNFMTRAAGSGLFEVEVAKLAADKASDESVKRFANLLMEQHTANNQELMSLASSKGVTLPTTMPSSKKRIVDKLAKQSGAEFDKEFVQMVGIKDHQEDIRMFQTASRDLKDPELKAFAAKTLPVLQQHLAEARKLPMAGDSSSASSSSGTSVGRGMSSGSTSSSGMSGTGSVGGANSSVPGGAGTTDGSSSSSTSGLGSSGAGTTSPGSGGTSGTPGTSGSAGTSGAAGAGGTGGSGSASR